MSNHEPQENVWNDAPTAKSKTKEPKNNKTATPNSVQYDLEGLMNDFPTAKELERFVYDETSIALNLKGRSQKIKYQIAMDVLNGSDIDSSFISRDNPYLDKADLIPEEPLRPVPDRDSNLPDRSEVQNYFHSKFVPHSDEALRADSRKVDVLFRKYYDGTITYEVEGPIDQRPDGMKIDRYGRERPEIIRWIDPRTGEQAIRYSDGRVTKLGQSLKSNMQKLKVNNSNVWDVWVDRDFGALNDHYIDNPWDSK